MSVPQVITPLSTYPEDHAALAALALALMDHADTAVALLLADCVRSELRQPGLHTHAQLLRLCDDCRVDGDSSSPLVELEDWVRATLDDELEGVRSGVYTAREL